MKITAMLADRLGAQQHGCERADSPPCQVGALMAWPHFQTMAASAYASSGSLESSPLVQWHYGALMVQMGRLDEGARLLQAALPHFKDSARHEARPEAVAAIYRALGQAEERRGRLGEARDHYQHAGRIYASVLEGDAQNSIATQGFANTRLDWARVEDKIGAPGAFAEAKAGLISLVTAARSPRASTDLMDEAAAALLTVRPASLRNAAAARQLAASAVQKSAAQVAYCLITLAAATGDPADLRRAAQAASEEAEMVRKLIPQASVAAFDANQAKLRGIASGK